MEDFASDKLDVVDLEESGNETINTDSHEVFNAPKTLGKVSGGIAVAAQVTI